MGKGSRNRINRESEPNQQIKAVQKPKKKVRRYRKPMSGRTKGIIAGCVAFLLVVGIVFGALASNGVFKRGNILVKSRTGDFDLNQQMATYMAWDTMYYYAYQNWSGLSSADKTAYNNSQVQYCLTVAASSVQDTLKTTLESYGETLRQFVALCDVAAEGFHITLTAEEEKEARKNARTQITYLANSNYMSESAFMKVYIGNNVKMKDIEDSAVMQTLADKVWQKKLSEVQDAVTDEMIEKYRNDNPESFYSTDYLLYTTTDAALKDLLMAATSVNAFKTVLVKDVFENGDSGFKVLFNKLANSNALQKAADVLKAVETKTRLEDLNAALTAQNLTAKDYEKTDATLPQAVKDWMFDTDRKAFDSKTIRTSDRVYTVVLTAAPAADKVNAAIADFALPSQWTYAGDVLTAIEKKTTLQNLNAALTAQGMALQPYSKDDAALNQTLKDWMFASARKEYDSTMVVTADRIYVAVLSDVPKNGSVSAAVKEFEMVSGETYGEDTAFKTNIYNTLLKQMDLLESTDGLTLYLESSDTGIADLLSSLKTAAEKVIPAVKTENYTKTPKDDTYQAWMFKGINETLTSLVKAGDVNSFSTTKDEVTTYSVYSIVEPMKLDKTPLVDGGYLEFTGEGHATKAQEFMNSLAGLTGDALSKKFTDNQNAVVAEFISEASITDKALFDWLSDSARKANDIGMISIPDSKANDDKDDSSTYVAFFDTSVETWKNSAENGHINKQMNDWTDSLIKDYTLDGVSKLKDQNPIETEAETTAATAAVTA